MNRSFIITALIAPLALAGCMSSTTYTGNGAPLLARGSDSAYANGSGPRDGIAAVAVTPDGCQAWLMDDGVEGYASTRSDPRTGLPVCDPRLPAGAVVGNPQLTGFPDILP